MENKHTAAELLQWQSLPLSVKVLMTRQRIRDWIDTFGEDGVYISFSGGKDSTVLLDIVRNVCGYKDCKAMFVDVPTQYPELRDFAKKFDNVDIVRPKMNFMQVCDKYGFPLLSKEVSENVYGAKKYLRTILDSNTITQTDRQTDVPYWYCLDRLCGTGKYSKRENAEQGRWQQSAISDYVRNADTQPTASRYGHYP